MDVYYFNRKISPEYVFLCLGLLLGTLYLLISPPFQIPDEQTHFWRAYQVSEGKLISSKQGDIAGGLIPRSLFVLPEKSGLFEVRFNPKAKITVQQILDAGKIPLEREKKMFVGFSNVVPYPPIPYLPQAIGISFGKVFDAHPLVLMYLGRFSNLCSSLVLVALAIRYIPIQKWTICLIALMPISIAEMASLSADSLTNSLSWLFIALVFHYALLDKQLKQKDKLIILGVSVALSLVKLSYLPMLALLVLIPYKKIGTKRDYILYLSGVFALVLILAGSWSILVREVYVPETWTGGNPDEQIKFILSTPLFFISLIFSTLLDKGINYLQMLGNLGWLDTPLPDYLMRFWWGVLLLVALIDNTENITLSWRQKSIIILVIAIVCFAILGLLYICCTPPGGEYFHTQGRYFLPIIPLFLILFQNRKFANHLKVKYSLVHKSVFTSIPIFVIISSVIAFSTIINRYY